MPTRPTLAELTAAVETAWCRHAVVRNLGLMLGTRLRFSKTVVLPLPPWLEALLWAFLSLLILLGDDPVREADREDLLGTALQVIRERAPEGGET